MDNLPPIIGPTFFFTVVLCVAIALTTYCIWKQRKLKQQRGERLQGTNLSVIRGVQNPVYELEQADEEINSSPLDANSINVDVADKINLEENTSKNNEINQSITDSTYPMKGEEPNECDI